MFAIRHIEDYRIKSWKSSSAIVKQIVQRDLRKRDLSADDVFAANKKRIFYVKGKCKASMKRGIRSMECGKKQTKLWYHLRKM